MSGRLVHAGHIYSVANSATNDSGYKPWWECKNSVDKKLGSSGCQPHSWDYGDNEDFECDPDTGGGPHHIIYTSHMHHTCITHASHMHHT